MQIEIPQGDETTLASGAIPRETPVQVVNDHFDGRGFIHAETRFGCFVGSYHSEYPSFVGKTQAQAGFVPIPPGSGFGK
jgi:hypothetical protein